MSSSYSTVFWLSFYKTKTHSKKFKDKDVYNETWLMEPNLHLFKFLDTFEKTSQRFKTGTVSNV